MEWALEFPVTAFKFTTLLAREQVPGEPPIASLILLFRAGRMFFSVLAWSLFAGYNLITINTAC